MSWKLCSLNTKFEPRLLVIDPRFMTINNRYKAVQNGCHFRSQSIKRVERWWWRGDTAAAKIITYGAGIRHEHDARCHHKPADNLAQTMAQTMTHSMSRRRWRSSILRKKVSYAKIAAEEGGGSRLMAVSLAGVPGLWRPRILLS